MIVPPYVPEPIEVEGNVAEAPYAVRLRFIRGVVALHFLSVVLVGLFAGLGIPSLPLPGSAGLLLASLLGLSIVRALARPKPAEQIFTIALSPLLFLSLAMVARDLLVGGWPIWALPIGLLCGMIYTFLSGRDFSFVWQFILGTIASSTAIWLVADRIELPASLLAQALLANAAFLFYFVYDLACLQSRRRPGELLGAVVDLYRDVLNIFTYSVRVIHHWQTHKIWSK